MSYDLVLWRGRPNERPSGVWNALRDGEKVSFVIPLVRADLLAAFRREFGADVHETEGSEIAGPAFDLYVSDGDLHASVCLGHHEDGLHALIACIRRAAANAGCSVFDPQTLHYRQNPMFPDAPVEEPADVSEVPEPSPGGFAPGAVALHPKFGRGRVVQVEGRGELAKVRVRFDVGEKVLIAAALRLEE